MTVLRHIDVGAVQAGDTVVINNNKFVVEFTEPEGYGYEMQLHDATGSKVRKCLLQGETVSLEI
jgi:hypothetical protein